MKLPSSFKLMGHTWKVKLIEPHEWKVEDCIGLCEADQHTIKIKKVGGTLEGHIFYHELLHAVFNSLGHEPGQGVHTEQIVDSIAGCLHQCLTTARFHAD